MAKAGEDKYYKRSGDSFYRMEHFDIEDMFGRRKKPSLKLSSRIENRYSRKPPHYDEHEILIYISIENNGRGTAKAPYLSFLLEEPYKVYPYCIDGNRNFGLPVLKSRTTKQHIYGASTNYVIHPGTSITVTAITTTIAYTQPNLSQMKDLHLKYVLASEDVATVEGIYTIKVDELLSVIRSA